MHSEAAMAFLKVFPAYIILQLMKLLVDLQLIYYWVYLIVDLNNDYYPFQVFLI